MFLPVICKITRFWVKLDNQIFQNVVYVPANLQHWQPFAYIFIQHLCNINVFECLLGVCKPELTSRRHEGILVFWESWRNLVVNSEEIELCKILGINVKLRNDKFKFSPIMEKKRCCDVTNVKYDCHGRFPRHISSSLLVLDESSHFLKFLSPV